jgi:hypothetical protein
MFQIHPSCTGKSQGSLNQEATEPMAYEDDRTLNGLDKKSVGGEFDHEIDGPI